MREHTYRVDLDGLIWFEDESYEAPLVYRAFFDNMQRAPDGRLFADCMGERCWVESEDTPFVIQSVSVDASGVRLHLSGEIEERLDPATLRVGRDNVLYADVRRGEFPARFTRKAYYQLAQHIAPENGGFVLRIAGKAWPIAGAPAAE